MKQGSGDIDFSEGSEDEDEESYAPGIEEQPDSQGVSESTESQSSNSRYPYFVRRNNVGDERNEVLQTTVRSHVKEGEPEFLRELADHLNVSEVSKTDAREFALLLAQENPEEVAEMMRDEGFDAVN